MNSMQIFSGQVGIGGTTSGLSFTRGGNDAGTVRSTATGLEAQRPRPGEGRRAGLAAGDLLVASATPGPAMRSAPREARPGTILGKALESLPRGEGGVLMLLTLH